MTTTLLVVDAQRIYTVKGKDLYCKKAGQTVKRINQLIEAFREKKQPVIFIRHVHKLDGSDLGRMFDFAGPASDFSAGRNTQSVRPGLVFVAVFLGFAPCFIPSRAPGNQSRILPRFYPGRGSYPQAASAPRPLAAP